MRKVLTSPNPPCISTVEMQGGFGDELELQAARLSKLETERVSAVTVPTKRVEFKPSPETWTCEGSLVLCNDDPCLVPAIGSVRFQVLKHIN
jgi:hypothetical protein